MYDLAEKVSREHKKLIESISFSQEQVAEFLRKAYISA
jgi:hypothetical protein